MPTAAASATSEDAFLGGALRVRQPAAQRQSETRALRVLLKAILDLTELFEHDLLMLGRDADARIDHVDFEQARRG